MKRSSASLRCVELALCVLLGCESGGAVGVDPGEDDPGLGARCDSASDCGALTPMCAAGGFCVQCVDGTGCGGDRPFCTAQGLCVECELDAHCGVELACVGGACSERCTSDGHCDGDRCLEGACVECASDVDCGGEGLCDLAARRCIECRTAGDCELDEPYCVEGHCRECIQNTDCESQLCTSELECSSEM